MNHPVACLPAYLNIKLLHACAVLRDRSPLQLHAISPLEKRRRGPNEWILVATNTNSPMGLVCLCQCIRAVEE